MRARTVHHGAFYTLSVREAAQRIKDPGACRGIYRAVRAFGDRHRFVLSTGGQVQSGLHSALSGPGRAEFPPLRAAPGILVKERMVV